MAVSYLRDAVWCPFCIANYRLRFTYRGLTESCRLARDAAGAWPQIYNETTRSRNRDMSLDTSAPGVFPRGEFMNNNQGAVVERARLAEDALCLRIDQKKGNPVSVGEGQSRETITTRPELISWAIKHGWSCCYVRGRIVLRRGYGFS